jgi:GDP-D-mannose 3', 5'-epimerase
MTASNGHRRILVTGAGGFIGHHLVSHLAGLGHWVRGVDVQPPRFAPSCASEFVIADLRRADECLRLTRGVHEVYALAADMGGMGYISAHHAAILHNNVLIDFNTLEAARQNGVDRVLFTSSACIYPEFRQMDDAAPPLKESDAFPAQPQDAYGWGKLLTEQLCGHYEAEYGIATRVVRLHNIFGPLGTWEGGREKAPAAICRKVAVAKLTGDPTIEVWGDGRQARSFCYIDDCVAGLVMVMGSDCRLPLNLGQDRQVTIRELVEMVADIACVDVEIRYVEGPQGVRSRNSDNALVQRLLGWTPRVSLETGLARTYAWICEQVRAQLAETAARPA